MMNQKIKIVLKSVFVLALFALSLSVFAQWQDPTAAPTLGNAQPPINVGSILQYKAGSIVADGLRAALSLITDLASVATFNGQIKITSGTPGAGKVLTSDATGIASWVTPSVSSQWTTSGSNIYYNTGNVGIGTTNPQWGKLVLSGADVIANNMLNLENTSGNTGDSTYIKFRHSTDGRVMAYIRDAIGLQTEGWNGSLVFGTAAGTNNPTDRMTIASNGNVGIGTLTPGTKLDVDGSVRFSGSSNITPVDGEFVYDTSVHAYKYYDSNAGVWKSLASGSITTTGGYWNQNGTNIYYNSGSVGIGTTTPATDLEIYGTSEKFRLTDTGSNSASYMTFYDTATRKWIIGQTAGGNFAIATGSGASLFNITSGGNVGIGIAAPGYKLDVVGDVNVTGNFKINGTNIGQWTTSGSNVYYNLGNVGIGTTGPAADLEISGTSEKFRLTDTGSNSASYMTFYDTATRKWIIGQTAGGNFAIATGSGASLFNITSGGNVGIGIAAPASKLFVAGGSYNAISGANNVAYALGAQSIAANDSIYSYGSICAGNSNGNCAGTGGVVITPSGITFPNGTVQTVAATSGTNYWTLASENIYNNSGANVGIGTTSPASLLTVNQSGNTIAATGNTYGLAVSIAESRQLTLGADATYAYIQSWNSKPLYINSQGNPVVIGVGASATGSNSVAMGQNTTASGANSTAIGLNTTASGVGSTAMGYNTTASGAGYSTAIGQGTTAHGGNSTAIGYYTMASGGNSFALGNSSTASGFGSLAMGASTTASGSYSTTIGYRTTAKTVASFVVGQYNLGLGGTDISTWIDTDPIFEVGIGTSATLKANALTVLKNGDTSFSGKVGIGTTAPGTSMLYVKGTMSVMPTANGLPTGLVFSSWHNSGETAGGIIDSYDADGTTVRSLALQQNQGGVGIGRLIAPNGSFKLEVEGQVSKTSSGSWQANSDRRIKIDISTINNAVNTLGLLRPVKFKYRDEYKTQHPSITDKYYYSFIAQEFQQVFPTEVAFGSDTLSNGERILSMDSYIVVPYLVKAIQEQQDIIKAQQFEIDGIKARLNKLEGK